MVDIVDEKDLKGTKADPDEPLLVTILNAKTHAKRNQLLKRRNLMKKTVMYTGIDNLRHFGSIIGFDKDTGNPYIFSNDGVEPAGKAEYCVLEQYSG